MSGEVEALADVLADHRPSVGYNDAHADLIACSCDGTIYEAPDYRAHVATALAERGTSADEREQADAQIRDLLEEREELLTEIRRLRMGNHPAGRAQDRQLRHVSEIASVSRGDCTALAEALTERDAEHEGGGGA